MAKKKSEKTNDFVLEADFMSSGQANFLLRNKVYLFNEDAKTTATFKGDVKRALDDLRILNAGWDLPQFNEQWFLFVLERHYGYHIKA